MSFIIFAFLLFLHLHICLADIEMPASTQIDSATKLAHCRAHCIDAFSHRFSKGDSEVMELNNKQCMADSDCWMCWDMCAIFQANSAHHRTICQQKTMCFEGCRLACVVYGTSSDSDIPDQWSFPSPPEITSDITAGWLRLRWPKVVPLSATTPPLPHVLYVLFWRFGPNQPWIQLEQTLSTLFDTRNGEIVVTGQEAEFMLLAVTRDGLVATARTNGARTTSTNAATTSTPAMEAPVDPNRRAKVQFILAIVGASLFAGLLCSIGLVFLYRMIQAQRRRNMLARANAIRIRTRSRQRYTSASSRMALITGLNVIKLDETANQHLHHQPQVTTSLSTSDRYTIAPDRLRFADLFKGTIFESPPPYDAHDQPGNATDQPHFSFSKANGSHGDDTV